MAKAPMDTLQLSCIQIAITLLLFTQAKSTTEDRSTHPNATSTSCIASERSALLAFRAGLLDPANLLSSWKGDGCCQWKGIYCGRRTSHVVRLDLQGSDCGTVYGTMQVLSGNISSSLLGLHHLHYLDLSCNNFDNIHIPEFLGSLHQLRYLDLSMSQFIGRIPPQLGNLSNLRYLNLVATSYSTDITWLSRLTSLEHLDMSDLNLNTTVHWLPVVNMLPTLRVLRLSQCQLRSSPDSLPLSNLTSLETLELSDNGFHKRSSPNWFWELTSLKHLDISNNDFYGPFPDEISNMTSMVKLDLSYNNLVGMIPSNMKNLCNLESFFSHSNNINGSITQLFHRLPSCSCNKLQALLLYECNLTGSLPTTLVESLRNLSTLDLSVNSLTGHVPQWIGKLTKLKELDLGLNNLDGVIDEGYLSGLHMLEILELSYNSIAITISPTWVPPFSLTIIHLGSCQLGPKFPMWLRWQTRAQSLDISNTSINDMVPDWFWIAASSVEYLNIRNNQITGVLPSTMEFMSGEEMDFSSNQLGGPIPKLPINLTRFDLSRNNVVGPLPSDFGAPLLRTLLLYNNMISGAIPTSLCKLQSLRLLDLSRNNLNGSITDCLVTDLSTNMTLLSTVNLSLRNNNLSGGFPSLLQRCPKLMFLDLGDNQFSGILPAWIGEKLSSLSFLRMRSNMFYGHIPVELMKLVNLQYLDLAYNNISGSIPRSIVNCTGMTQTREMSDDDLTYAFTTDGAYLENEIVEYAENFTVLTKGQERLYTGEIIYMVNLDLSCNSLTGEIPTEISALVELKSLNLSWNNFSEKVPENIGALMQVESLDLSHNELSGEIPSSLSALTSLSRLNLSYNNLSGKIPTGNQLQTLEDQKSIYIGNPGLCGPPLSQKCLQPEPIPLEQHGDASGDVVSFFISTASGYVMGLWVVFCAFLFKRKWRVSWFSHCDHLYDRAYVQVAVTWASLRVNING